MTFCKQTAWPLVEFVLLNTKIFALHSQCSPLLSLKTSNFLPVWPLFLHTHAYSVHKHTHKHTLPPAVIARVNMSIVWPAHQALIPECLQAAEGKELKVSVCEAFTHSRTQNTHTRTSLGYKTMATFTGSGMSGNSASWVHAGVCVFMNMLKHGDWRLEIT